MTKYRVFDAGTPFDIDADSMEEAIGLAKADTIHLYQGLDDDVSTQWVDLYIFELDDDGKIIDDSEEKATVTADPIEPPCTGSNEHDWQAPHSIVGGIKENPGVWGHGGGVRINEVCLRCRCGKTTDTWDQRPDTGEQGLLSVSYEEDRYREESHE